MRYGLATILAISISWRTANAVEFNHGGNWGKCEQGASAIAAIRTRLNKCLAGNPDPLDSDRGCEEPNFKKYCKSSVKITVTDSYIAWELCHNISPLSTIRGFLDGFTEVCITEPSKARIVAEKIKNLDIVWDYAAYKKFNPSGDANIVGEVKYDEAKHTVHFIAGDFVDTKEQVRKWFVNKF